MSLIIKPKVTITVTETGPTRHAPHCDNSALTLCGFVDTTCTGEHYDDEPVNCESCLDIVKLVLSWQKKGKNKCS